MQPNPQPPTNRALSDVLSPATRAIYDQSQQKLKIGMVILDILVVLYTLPHGLHAFGITWANPIAALGVATIEGVFVLATSHFIFGLVSTKAQYTYAVAAVTVTGALLASNSVLSQLLYMQDAGRLTEGMASAVTFYQGFALPLTPVIAFICAVLLMAHHPKVVEIGRTMAHVASVTAAEQSADRQRQQAIAETHAAKTAAEAAKLYAQLDADRMRHEVALKQYELATHEQMATIDFEMATSAKVLEHQIARMNDYLESDTFARRIGTQTSQKISKIFARLEAALQDEAQPTPTPRTAAPTPFNIEAAVLPQPIPTSYASGTNGHGHPNPTSPYGD